MSTLAQAVTGLKDSVSGMMSKPADKPLKPAKTDNSKKSELELLINKDVASDAKLDKAEQSAFESFKAVVFEANKCGVFGSNEKLSNLKLEVKNAFVTANSKGYEKRISILSNLQLIINGGTSKEGKAIKGWGWAFVQALFDNHKQGGIKAFAALTSSEVPEGLGRIPDKAKRAEREAKRKAAEAAKQAGNVTPEGTVILNAESACDNLMLSIRMAMHYLQAGSDSALIAVLSNAEAMTEYKLECIRKGNAQNQEKDITPEKDALKKVA